MCPEFVLEVSERPQANPLARLQAKRGMAIINAWHCRGPPGRIWTRGTEPSGRHAVITAALVAVLADAACADRWAFMKMMSA